MHLTRRQFLGAAGLTAAASAAGAQAASVEGEPMSPAINPVWLTGSPEAWPLGELAAAGYRGLEVTPGCLERAAAWQDAARAAGMRVLCVNAMPELRPYLTGSLSDAVEWRRAETLGRLSRTLAAMQPLGVPFLLVAPSRLAENYQSPAEARDLLVSSLRTLGERAGASTILLAAAPFRLFADSAAIGSVVDEVAHPRVAAALDIGHALLAGENPAAAAAALGDRLRYVQVHDADARPGVARLDRHLPLGAGSMQRAEARSAVGRRPFAVGVTAPHDPVTAAREALRWLG